MASDKDVTLRATAGTTLRAWCLPVKTTYCLSCYDLTTLLKPVGFCLRIKRQAGKKTDCMLCVI
jgi:hypothetical protein